MRKIYTFLIISVTLIVWIDYVPFKLPSFVSNPEKAEFVIYNLALAYIASYIFYYINDYLPKKRDSKTIKRVIHNNVLFIVQYRNTLRKLQSRNFDINQTIKFGEKEMLAHDFLKKLQKDLHYNLDAILTVKERLPTGLLHNTLLLKRHPYFKSSFSEFTQLDKLIKDYDLLTTRLQDEFKKL